ncbi:TonB-dependent receptor plug domain-containing protein [Veillonella agrestimuris]|uniref:TonB-dependent receptor plug domain-containing protein n=1 Tax=Veillonella agrestimuris TaxID=2941340 RepID=UPI00203C07CD|nr:TonB-dependent receptor [Veillonella agrestimuris]
MNQKLLKAIVLSALTVAIVPTVQAAEYQLDDMIITGTRVKTEVKDVAANVTVINNENIEKGNYSNVSQALQAANVDVVDHGSAAYPVLNGDTRVLVLVNGRRVNFDHLTVSGNDNAVDINQVPMDNVDHIEIVRGPNSALYGQKAVAGVINIITKEPTPETRTTLTAEYGTWNQRRGAITHSGGDELNRYMVTYSREKRDNYDYRDSNGNSHEFPDSYKDREDMTFRYDRFFGKDRATFDFGRSHAKDGYGIYLTNPTQGIAYGQGSKFDSTITNIGVTYTFNQKEKGEGTFLRFTRNGDRTDSPFAGTPYEHDLRSYTFEGQKNWTVKNHDIVGGIAWEEQHLWENNDGSTMDAKAITKSIFAEDRWTLGDGWSLNLGGRYEHHSDYGGDWTSHVGVNKRLGEDTHVYASWGTAVNNPTLKMRYANTPYMQGNPDLEQETSRTFTVGVDSKINDKLSVSASVYDSKLKNALNWRWNGVTRYYNVDEEKRRGMSLGATYKINDAWRVRAGYDYSRIRINGENDARNTRPNGYNIGLTYNKNKWDITNNLTYVTGRSDLYTSNSYFLWDMNINYQWRPDTKFYIKGYNLTNEHYESSAATNLVRGAYAMPKRHFVAGVTHSF